MLKTRLITAAIFSITVIYILSFCPLPIFSILLSCLIALSIFLSGTEFIALRWNIMDGPSHIEKTRPTLKFKHFLVGFSYSVTVMLYYFFNTKLFNLPERFAALPVTWVFLCLFIATALIYKNAIDMHTASNKLLNIIAGFIYLSLPGICFVRLTLFHFEGAYRSALIYFCLATVLMGDTGAYFIGSWLGRHKFIPRVSPKKSVEGALGGLLFSGVTAMCVGYLFKLPFPFWFFLISGICIGFAGQIGDLMESAFKRAGGYKDSGNLLPGHGGFLDRIDSLVLGIPITFIFFTLY